MVDKCLCHRLAFKQWSRIHDNNLESLAFSMSSYKRLKNYNALRECKDCIAVLNLGYSLCCNQLIRACYFLLDEIIDCIAQTCFSFKFWCIGINAVDFQLKPPYRITPRRS